MGNIQKPRDIETRHAAIAERMGSKVKYNCDSETTVSSRTAKVILITPMINKKAIPVILKYIMLL